MKLQQITSNLVRKENGIWFARTSEDVAYPAEGNQSTFRLEAESYWFAHRNSCILTLLRHFPPSGPFVDIGGGNGFVSAAIQKAGIEVILLEPGVEGATNAKRRGVDSVICSTFQAAEFQEKTIPAVGLFDVIEHIEDDVAFLASIRNILRPGGRLYLTVPAYQWLWSVEDDYAQHYRRYTIRSLRRKLETLGFETEYTSYMFACLPIPIFLFRIIPGSLFGPRVTRERTDKREHNLPGGWPGRALEKLLQLELRALDNKKSIPFGGSCILVARRP